MNFSSMGPMRSGSMLTTYGDDDIEEEISSMDEEYSVDDDHVLGITSTVHRYPFHLVQTENNVYDILSKLEMPYDEDGGGLNDILIVLVTHVRMLQRGGTPYDAEQSRRLNAHLAFLYEHWNNHNRIQTQADQIQQYGRTLPNGDWKGVFNVLLVLYNLRASSMDHVPIPDILKELDQGSISGRQPVYRDATRQPVTKRRGESIHKDAKRRRHGRPDAHQWIPPLDGSLFHDETPTSNSRRNRTKQSKRYTSKNQRTNSLASNQPPRPVPSRREDDRDPLSMDDIYGLNDLKEQLMVPDPPHRLFDGTSEPPDEKRKTGRQHFHLSQLEDFIATWQQQQVGTESLSLSLDMFRDVFQDFLVRPSREPPLRIQPLLSVLGPTVSVNDLQRFVKRHSPTAATGTSLRTFWMQELEEFLMQDDVMGEDNDLSFETDPLTDIAPNVLDVTTIGSGAPIAKPAAKYNYPLPGVPYPLEPWSDAIRNVLQFFRTQTSAAENVWWYDETHHNYLTRRESGTFGWQKEGERLKKLTISTFEFRNKHLVIKEWKKYLHLVHFWTPLEGQSVIPFEDKNGAWDYFHIIYHAVHFLAAASLHGMGCFEKRDGYRALLTSSIQQHTHGIACQSLPSPPRITSTAGIHQDLLGRVCFADDRKHMTRLKLDYAQEHLDRLDRTRDARLALFNAIQSTHMPEDEYCRYTQGIILNDALFSLCHASPSYNTSTLMFSRTGSTNIPTRGTPQRGKMRDRRSYSWATGMHPPSRCRPHSFLLVRSLH